MVKKIDKAEFIARLDGTLEEKIYEAFYCGFERGYQFGQECPRDKLPHKKVENWMINVDYYDWQDDLMNPIQEKEVEK